MHLSRRALVALTAGLIVLGVVGPSLAEPLGPPIDPHNPALVRGLPDPGDPPQTAMPDPDIAVLDIPTARPWLLATPAEFEAARDRIEAGRSDPTMAPVTTNYTGLKKWASACCAGRQSFEDGFKAVAARDYGRDDLALLGFLHQLDGGQAHIDKAVGLIEYLVATTPDHGAPREPGVDEFYIQRAHRLSGLAIAYDLLADALPQTSRLQLRDVIGTLARQQFTHAQTAWWGTVSSGSNIGAHNAAALAMAGLALWHEDPDARAWVVRGEQLTRSYFHEGFGEDGASVEGILYGNYGMRIATFLINALRQAGHTSDLSQVGGIDRHQEWVAYELLPEGGGVNPMNDARYLEFNPYFTTWSSTHGDTPELSRWIFDRYHANYPTGPGNGDTIPTILWYQPVDPEFDPAELLPLSKAFHGRGLVAMRSGWEAGDLLAAFESRQNDWGEGVHQNQDVNSFTLYSDGARLVVDSRYGNWLSEMATNDTESARTSESEGHSYIVADGRSQDFLGKGDLQTFVSTTEVGDPGLVEIAVGDARQAWMTDQPQRAERVFTHIRADGEAGTADYVVVADRFTQGGGDHDYTWFLHSDWTNRMTVADGPGPIRVRVDATAHDPALALLGEPAHPYRNGAPRTAGMEVTIHTTSPSTAAVGTFTPLDTVDWTRYGLGGGTRTQPRLELSTTAPSLESLAVLSPTGSGETAPTTTAVPATGGLALRVEHDNGTVDLLLLRSGDSDTVTTEGLSTDAIFAFVRLDADGNVVTHAMVDGTQFDHDEEPLVDTDGERVSVVAEPDAVGVDAPGPVSMRVRAAAGVRVAINDGSTNAAATSRVEILPTP